MADHIVKQGDCLSSIAKAFGLTWERIWDEPANADLRAERKNPNVLRPGDRLVVPEQEERTEAGGTEQRHRFVRKGVPAKLRLRFLGEAHRDVTTGRESKGSAEAPRVVELGDEEPDDGASDDKPRAGVPYSVTIDGTVSKGTTDGDGVLELSIPPNARRGLVILEPGTPQETRVPLRLGTLDPLDDLVGVKQRLANLGFECGDRSGEATAALDGVVRRFQSTYDLPVTGEVDDATRAKLRDVHGA